MHTRAGTRMLVNEVCSLVAVGCVGDDVGTGMLVSEVCCSVDGGDMVSPVVYFNGHFFVLFQYSGYNIDLFRLVEISTLSECEL